MREIKFRGWDEENNCWRYGWYSRLQEGARKFDAIICDEDGTLVRYYIHDRKTIGQYTGYKDKNQTEVYEGDLIPSHNLVVCFGEYDNGLDYEELDCGYGFYFWNPDYPHGQSSYDPSRVIEVKGNIHERGGEYA